MQSSDHELVIDGSAGEGGGQMLRTSLSLSALTGRPFRLEKIRAGRSRPGLRPQHLTAVHAMAAICRAELSGAEIDSQTLTFRPTVTPQAGRYIFDVTDAAPNGRSAGAVTLILQTVLWPLLFAAEPSMVTLRGGTHVNYSPSFHYIQHVFRPTVARMGAHFTAELIEYGWMPAGEGQIKIEINPATRLRGIDLLADDRGRDENLADEDERETDDRLIKGQSIVTNLPGHIPHRMARRADNLITAAGYRPQIEARRLKAGSAGAGIFLWLANGLAGAGGLGRQGVAAQDVAAGAVEPLLRFVESEGVVDQHLADQLLLPAALAVGQTLYTTDEVTQHTLTNCDLIKRWLPETGIAVAGTEGESGRIEITGRSE